MSSGTLTRKRTYTTIEVEVDISDLADNGWHSEEDCEGAPARSALREAGEAITSLHRQAHPSQHPDPSLCREEPCRSLTLDVLRLAGGR